METHGFGFFFDRHMVSDLSADMHTNIIAISHRTCVRGRPPPLFSRSVVLSVSFGGSIFMILRNTHRYDLTALKHPMDSLNTILPAKTSSPPTQNPKFSQSPAFVRTRIQVLATAFGMEGACAVHGRRSMQVVRYSRWAVVFSFTVQNYT
jgi:hypothetical protein